MLLPLKSLPARTSDSGGLRRLCSDNRKIKLVIFDFQKTYANSGAAQCPVAGHR